MGAARNGRLHKGQTRVIGGVCSGLAEHFHVDVVLVRVAFVVLAFMSGIGLFLYLLLWLLMPEAEAPEPEGIDVVRSGLRSMEADIARIGQQLKKPASG